MDSLKNATIISVCHLEWHSLAEDVPPNTLCAASVWLLQKDLHWKVVGALMKLPTVGPEERII